jgi:hypothetical protein
VVTGDYSYEKSRLAQWKWLTRNGTVRPHETNPPVGGGDVTLGEGSTKFHDEDVDRAWWEWLTNNGTSDPSVTAPTFDDPV